MGYSELEENYDSLVTDLPSIYTTLVTNGKRKTVRNYGSSAPASLSVLQNMIDDLLRTAKWNKFETGEECEFHVWRETDKEKLKKEFRR